MSKKGVTVTWNDPEGRLRRNAEAAQVALDAQILKDTDPYVPFDTGNLRNEGIRASTTPGEIVWPGPYAARQYYEYPNKSRDVHPLATSFWFEAAKAVNLGKWLAAVKRIGGRP